MKQNFKKLYELLGRQYQKSFVLVFLSMLTLALFEVLSIGIILPFLKLIIDEHNDVSNLYLSEIKSTFGLEGNDLIILVGLMIIGIFLIKNILHYFINKFQASTLHQIRVDISKKLFSKYIEMNYSLFIEKNISSMIHNATGQVNAFVVIFLQSMLHLISELVIVIAILILLLIVDPVVMLILSSAGFILVAIIMRKFKKTFKDIGKKQNDATVSMYKVINEGISALKEIRVLKVEQYFTDIFDQHSIIYQDMAIKSSAIRLIPKLILEFIFISSLIIVVIVSISMKYNMGEFIPTLILFAMAFFKIFPSVNRIINDYNLMLSSKISFDVLYDELMSTKDDFKFKRISNESSITFKDKITLQNVTFAYKNSENIFKNFSMEIPKNKTIALIGQSGSGKTTIVDLILGLIQPQKGSIKFDNYDISKNLDNWYQKIGYIPQFISFIDDTIRKNIALGIHDIDEKRLEKSIDDAQLRELIDSMPKGLDTRIGDKGIKLSGGQRQRVGIARALYSNPDILIFDEATSALDVETERALTESIHKLGHSKTIIIVAHRLSTIKDSDTIFILGHGTIMDSGTYNELLMRNQWFQEINK